MRRGVLRREVSSMSFRNWRTGVGRFSTVLLFVVLSCAFVSIRAQSGRAQVGQPAPVDPQQETAPRPEQSLNIADALNLTPEQRAQMQTIRRESADEFRRANLRVTTGEKALDDAIYSEDADEAVIQQRARELAEAMATRIRVRTSIDLRVRRILTTEQLVTLRDLRDHQRGNPLRPNQIQQNNNQRPAMRPNVNPDRQPMRPVRNPANQRRIQPQPNPASTPLPKNPIP
jgi:Spy/CpxP family protein refolding chaperone